MSAINPQDPVIQMLKQVVEQYEERVATIESALEQIMQANARALASLASRVTALESRVALPVREDTEGKEL